MMDRNDSQLKDYEAPAIVDYGNVTEITQAVGGHTFLDADFPEGTDEGDLTFS